MTIALRAAFSALFMLVCAGGVAGAQDLCEAPNESCSRLVAPHCLERLGAGATAVEAGSDCAGPLTTYRECLSTVASLCGRGASAGGATQSEPNFKKTEAGEAGMARTIEVIQHEAAPLTGCVAAESLPKNGVYLISLKTMFCRPDGAIWLRFTQITGSYGNAVKWANVFQAKKGGCNAAAPSCMIEDDVSGVMRMQVLGVERAQGQEMMRVMLSKD